MKQHALCPTGRTGLTLRWGIVSLLLLAAMGVKTPLQAQTTLPEQKPPAKAPAASDATLPSVETVRAAAEKAYGDLSAHGTWRIAGTPRRHGADQNYEMIFDDRFRFRIRASGALSETEAFDGSTYWTIGPSGVPHRVILLERDTNRLLGWALTGAWAAKNAPLVRTVAAGDSGELVLTLRPKDGVVQATLRLDATTFEPKSLTYWTETGNETWTFSAYRSFGGRKLPAHVAHGTGQPNEDIDFVSMDRIKEDAGAYRMTNPKRDPAEYDAAASDRVEVKRIQGLLFVRPRVNGEELGWFFLDTGADVMCIDPSMVKKLNLSVVGSDDVAGAVGVSHMRICRATTLQLGPVIVPEPVFLELDLAPFAQALKIPIVGICGYDFLARASLEIDPQSDTIHILKPGAAPLPEGAKWTRIRFNSNTPCLECSFAEKHRGFFTLDTGSNGTVDFFAPAIEKYHLLEHQNTTRAQTGGAGGSVESQVGKIAWFELGGNRIESPSVGFQSAKTGAFASPYMGGNVGMGFMGKYRMVLDYANERIAFVEKQE